MILKRFILYSLIIHLLAMSFFFVSPVKKEHKKKFFYTSLVGPEEITDESNKGIGITPPSGNEARELLTLPPPDVNTKRSAVSSQQSADSGEPQKKIVKNEKPAVGGQEPEASTQRSENLRGSQGLQPGADARNVQPESTFIPPGTGTSFGKRIDLLDKEVVEKIAKKEEEEDKKEKNTVSFDAKEFKYYGYMKRLKEKIEGIWQYPSDAATKGIYGDLYISFTIKRDGTLGAIDLMRTSGYRDLDDAAMKALKGAAPYWPLPEEWKKDSLTITGHFIYSLYGVYVR